MSSGCDLSPLSQRPVHSSVGIEDEPWEGAIFVAVAPVSLAPIQFNENLIACIQMKDDTVASVVITLVLVLGNGAGPDLELDMHAETRRKEVKKCKYAEEKIYNEALLLCIT